MLLGSKLIKKIPDPRNAKDHYQLSKIITYQPKTFENSNIADVKLVITEHPKTSHKLSKTIRQAEKIGSNSPLYSDTKKVKIF